MVVFGESDASYLVVSNSSPFKYISVTLCFPKSFVSNSFEEATRLSDVSLMINMYVKGYLTVFSIAATAIGVVYHELWILNTHDVSNVLPGALIVLSEQYV